LLPGCGYWETEHEEEAIEHAMKALSVADLVAAMTEILQTAGGKDATEPRPLASASPADMKSDPMEFAKSLRLGEDAGDGRALVTN
jgi:hypothetical protein